MSKARELLQGPDSEKATLEVDNKFLLKPVNTGDPHLIDLAPVRLRLLGVDIVARHHDPRVLGVDHALHKVGDLVGVVLVPVPGTEAVPVRLGHVLEGAPGWLVGHLHIETSR
jgi:hypothetical protein